MFGKQLLKNLEDICVEPGWLRKSFRARVRVEAGIADGQRQRARRQSRFAKALTRFLREMAEQGMQRFGVIRVFPKGMIVRNGFWLGVDNEFVGIAAPRFTIERIAPLAKDFFEFFGRDCSELIHGFDAKRSQRPFRDFADAWNFPHRKRRKKSRFLARRNPYQATRLRLVRGYFRDEPRRSQPRRTGKLRRARNGAEKFVGCSQRRPVQSFRSR